MQRINKAIEENVVKVLERVELADEQLDPMKIALVQYFAPVQMERLKMQAERRKMQQNGGGRGQGGPGGGNRQAMIARMAKLDKLRSELDKKVKGILDKQQLKQFRKTMDEVAPQQRRGPGGGRGR